MFTEQRCYTVSCDTCGDELDGYDYVPHFPTTKDFEADIYEWTVWKDKAWCSDCMTPDCWCTHGYADHAHVGGACEESWCPCQSYRPTTPRQGERE